MLVSASFVLDTEKTNIKHNNREMSDREKAKNSHIDFDKVHENKYLVQEDLKEFYEKEFGRSQEEFNKKQKRADRKIDSYFEHIKKSKKTKVQQELIIQIGDFEMFKNNEQNRKAANEALEVYFKEFVERNSSLKIYNAVIHNDEASPHLHINFVPVAEGYKRGLDKQVSFNRALQQQSDFLKDSERPFSHWRERELDELEELIVELGAKRKKVGTNYYKDVNEYKKAMRERANDFEYSKLQDELKNAEKLNLELSGKVDELLDEKSALALKNEDLEDSKEKLEEELSDWKYRFDVLWHFTKEFAGEATDVIKTWFKIETNEDLEEEKNKKKSKEYDRDLEL